MKEYGRIPVKPEVHYRYKLYAARHGLQIMEVAERALALLEAQNELPHPPDGTPVPLVYQEKSK